MYRLYYTVEKYTEFINEVEETTGVKGITVYEMIDNIPKIFCQIESYNNASSELEIQEWLDDNGYEDKEFEFVIL